MDRSPDASGQNRWANMAPRSKRENVMANDYDAMPMDDFFPWRRRTATSEVTHRDGDVIVASSRRSCPHRWIDDRGPIDLERTRSNSYKEWS